MGISIWQLLIILVIVILLFGTKKLKNLGGDLGDAFKSFKKAVNEDDAKNIGEQSDDNSGRIIEGDSEPVVKKDKNK